MSLRRWPVAWLLGAGLGLAADGAAAEAPAEPAPVVLASRRPGGLSVPRPLITAEYLDLELVLERGGLRPVGLRAGRLARPALLPRYRGPFELRVYAGRQLLDVLGFGFPLTLIAPAGASDDEARLDRALAAGVRARMVVRLPHVPSVTAIELYDSRERRSQRWPIERLRQLLAKSPDT